MRGNALPACHRAPAGAAMHADQVGTYLTDEVFLYRVADVLVTGAGEMAELEDCYWLDIVRVPISDVLARRLRVVTPTWAQASERDSTAAPRDGFEVTAGVETEER